MPRLPRVSGAQVVRALERLGFSVVRQRGSHIIMRRAAGGCVVPNHREIKSAPSPESFVRPVFQRTSLLQSFE
jgi:predicted RNA binding protein YcfA (HicA-like mRNA interferase family)